MGEYVNSGKLVSHVEDKITLIARAEDNEKAQFLATAANAYSTDTAVAQLDAFDYVAEASLTLSGEFHGELVGRELFDCQLAMAINALNALDKVKKTLFYGRDNGLRGELGHTNCYSLLQPITRPELYNGGGICSPEEAENFIHGVIGLATEAGELLELLRDTLEGKPLDRFNLKEEVGDGKWYMAILAKVGRFMWGDDERVNIEKLRARFPNRFTEYDANNRDLSVERDILEGDADKQLDLLAMGDPATVHKSLDKLGHNMGSANTQ